ncbi:hypothetical protein AAHU20_25915 (plasmid) [Klebsiella pneumoniae]
MEVKVVMAVVVIILPEVEVETVVSMEAMVVTEKMVVIKIIHQEEMELMDIMALMVRTVLIKLFL